ncbi:hypothetical protein [Novosphingobium sp.]
MLENSTINDSLADVDGGRNSGQDNAKYASIKNPICACFIAW